MSLTQINKAGLDEIALDHVFTIGASGTDHYTFQGEGLNGTVNDATLYLTRGKTYRFENGTGGHPIRIQSTQGASGTAYNTGVTNNASAGTVIVEVQHDAPDVLYYQCTSHANMNGVLYITGALADGGVTTAKIADDAVTNAKIGASAVGRTEIANAAISSDKIDTGQITTAKLGDLAVSTAKLGNDAVTTAKIADNAVTAAKLADVGVIDNTNQLGTAVVTTTKIADEAVTLAKLPHGTSSNNGKFLRANNGADPTFETVSTDLVADTSPQLGGTLDSNGNVISLGDATGVNSNRIKLGAGNDFHIYHNGTNSTIREEGDGDLLLHTNNGSAIKLTSGSDENMVVANKDGDVELYHNGTKKFETRSDGVTVQSSGSSQGINVKHSNGNVVASMHNKGSGDEGYLVLYDAGEVPTITADAEHGRIFAKSIRLHTDDSSHELDDYEEGTFTISLSNTSGGDSVSGGTMHYTKIGRWVNCWGQANFGTNSIGGVQAAIGGWPFVLGSHSSNDVGIWMWNNGTQLQGMNVTIASMSASTANTTWGLYVHTYNGAPSITGNQCQNSTRVSLGYSYEAS